MHDYQSVGAGDGGIEPLIRPANDGDLSGVKSITDAHPANCYSSEWDEGAYAQTIRTDGVSCIVADVNGLVGGYVVVDTSTSDIVIERMAIDPLLIRCKIGSQLVHHLKQKLSMRGLRRIVAEVPEENLRAQQFFRSQGLKVKSKPIKGDEGRVWYRFQFEFMWLFGGRNL